jgi:hypothetical protein
MNEQNKGALLRFDLAKAMALKPLISFGLCLGSSALISAVLASFWGDWFMYVSGPTCVLVVKHEFTLFSRGYPTLEFNVTCLVCAVAFAGVCSFLRRWMAVLAGVVWVGSGFFLAGLNGLFE